MEITDLAYGGRGVGRVAAMVVFVDGALAGERVRARIDKVRRGFAEAHVVEILRPSDERITPACPHYGVCGGCDLQHLERGAQARWKAVQVRSLMRRVGGLEEPPVSEAIAAGAGLRYRFRMDFDWHPAPGGAALPGLHRRGHGADIVPIQRCELTPRVTNEIVRWLGREASARRLHAWDRRRRRGLLRRLSIQEAHGTGEILVGLETGRGDPPALSQLAGDLMRRFPRVVGVVRREIDKQGVRAGDSILAGRDLLHEQVGEDRFRIPAQEFFQPNPTASALLRRQVMAALDPRKDDAILELYCGVGFLTVALGRLAREVTGVEGSRAACMAARANAANAGRANCRILHGEVAAMLPELLSRTWAAVLLDPPRVGLPGGAARALACGSAPRVVYVSCDPATLARDVKILTCEGEYRLTSVVPIDMFPQTHHVECVARLDRP